MMSLFRKIRFFFQRPKPAAPKIIEQEEYLPLKMKYFDSISPQNLSLPKPILQYLIKNANVEHIKKLQQTCRYFYSIFNFNVVDVLRINPGYKFYMGNYWIDIPERMIEEFFKNNLRITKRLYICQTKKRFEKLFQKIVKFEISELHIDYYAKLTIADFRLLVQSKNLQNLKIYADIYKFDNTKAPLEDILSLIPNVVDFENWNCTFTSKTMQKLVKLKRNVKFQFLELTPIPNIVDPLLFFKFFKENLDFNVPSTMIQMYGDKTKLQQIFELVKPWREKSYFIPHECFLLVI